ncbi:PREDICTED: probable carboxylesterase 18 [Tarenaya hassleriana]|uniref:probable carboxylesterase 18 n=1 Tax=Tarenaya hassleriana TaxID=28532 RepID=UPI00053C9633|nr:PREDICTED: probable carboxylesterase 18 [Tarenaya hassleriana]
MATEIHPKQRLSIPLKTRLTLSLASTFIDRIQRPDGSLPRGGFFRLFDFRSPVSPRPSNGVSTADFSVDPSRDLWFRVFSPHVPPSDDGSRRLPVVFFFHGGGFVFLSPDSIAYDRFCRRFAREIQAYIVSVNYRLAPEHRYPAQYDDGFDALKFLDENHATILPPNADVTKCFLVGDSAGGNIAHNVAVRSCSAGFGAVKITGIIAIQPFFGGEERTEAEERIVGAPLISVRRTDWSWKAVLPEGSNRDHVAANVSGPNAVDISGEEFPATMVIVGGFDPLQDWQRRYYEWLKKSGKRAELLEYPNMFHAFYIFPQVAESREMVVRIKDFVDERVAALSA